MKILITGADGQLGRSIQDVAKEHPQLVFVNTDYRELDITDPDKIDAFFKDQAFDYCVNCAAYTMVDKAESDSNRAFQLNADAVDYLAISCKKHAVCLIHISTDFVFDGSKKEPYTEEDIPNPINVYGLSKLKGEQYIQDRLENYFIVRTSWLYSEYGQNFVKTMLRLGRERDTLNVVSDQVGTPTYARDLAKVILKLIVEDRSEYGTYHYSNEGVASWYDFAMTIFDLGKVNCKVLPISTEAFPTAAKRPSFSVIDKTKLKSNFNVEIPHWRDSLALAIPRLIT